MNNFGKQNEFDKVNIVYLPLDERPCNYNFPNDLLSNSNKINLIEPDINILGKKKLPGDYLKIKDFLLNKCFNADILVISLDQLLYGGIVPSRIHNLEKEELLNRFNVLKTIKENNKKIKIYAFSLIMRCPQYSSSDEEPDYYELCGREIFLLGELINKEKCGLITEKEFSKLYYLLKEKTKLYLDDFLLRRQKNKEMNILAIQNTNNKNNSLIDYLVIPQDDSAKYGFTTMDREEIKQACPGFTNMFPGADEVGMTLIARSIQEKLLDRKLKIYCDYSSANAKNIIPLYEDRNLVLTTHAQILNSGCEEVFQKEEADIILFMSYLADGQIEVSSKHKMIEERSELNSFCDRIVNEVNKKDKVIGLVDKAYCNGGDLLLLKSLSEKISLFALDSYAGWNTSSNSMGTVIANCIVNYFSGKNDSFLAKRIYEDIGYCGYVRKKITDSFETNKDLNQYNYFNVYEKSGYISKLVKESLNEYIKNNLREIYDNFEIVKCEMPWKRMFEVEIEVKKRKINE